MPFHRQSRPRLMKIRSSDNTAMLASTDAYLQENHHRTSFSDLKSNARTCLPRQSTFPEDIGTAAEMPPLSKHRLSRMASVSALDIDASLGTSSITVNSLDAKRVASGASMDAQRSPGLPALPETMSKIDIEQAINLLQELRKTASPEELVSLHKALLPTRTVSPVPPPQLSSIEEHAAFSALSGRVRSERPPGLATRGSILEDPLRSQEEVAAKTAKSKETEDSHGAWFQETMSAFHARNGSMTSTGTAPDSSYSRTGGAYGLGTLRITNGRAASPEPGLISKLASGADGVKTSAPLVRRSEEAPVPAQELNHKSLKHQRRHSQDSINGNSALSLAQRRHQQWGLRTSRPISSLSSVVQHKPDGPRHDHHQAHPYRRRDTTDLPSTLRVSTDIPRYEQRWHHRASHLSNEYMLDCDINSSPYDDQIHELPEQSKRLSTVRDSESGDSPGIAGAADACAQALLKLTSSPVLTTPQGGSKDQNFADANTEERDADVATSRFSFDAIPKRPSDAMHKQDSGYCSEISNPVSKHTSPSGSKKSTTMDATPERMPGAPNASTDDTKLAGLPHPNLTATTEPADDVQSAAKTVVTTEPVESKKRLSPLAIFKSRNRASKRNSTIIDASPPVPRSNDALPRTSSAQGGRPVSAKSSADLRRKTLQKRMPEPVRHQREEAQKARHSMDVSQATESKSIAESSSTMPDQPRTVIKHVPLAMNASDADDELSIVAPLTDKPTRSWGRRSKSFARRRSKTIEEEEHEDSPSTLVPASPPKRRRSKSLAGPGVVLSRRPSMDTYCIRGSNHDVVENTHADPQSVARSLDLPHEVTDGNAISTMPKAMRNGSLRSKKSRESLVRANASKRQEAASAQDATTPGPPTAVQDLYPEWKSRPAAESSSPAAQDAQIASALPPTNLHRSAYDAIPPLPELPADLHSMLCKADLMMSKKLKSSPKTSPRASARNSVDSGRRQRAANDLPEGAQGPDLSMSLFAQTVVGEPPMVDSLSDSEMPAEVDGQALHKRQFSFEPLTKPLHVAAEAIPRSPTHDARHTGWPGWEQQSARWRQRLSIPAHAAELPGENEIHPTMCESPTVMTGPASPSIVVSRYITPLSAETAAHRSNSAHKRSSTVQVVGHSSGGSEMDRNADDIVLRRSNSIVSTSTYVTMTTSDGPPSKIEVSRNDSAFSQTTTTTTTTTTSLYTKNNDSSATLPTTRSTSASQVSPHSKYMPYRPTDSMHAERSRALNMARRSCQLKAPDIEPNMALRASTEVFDRYGGGLGYGWDRHAGLVGSAGTRNTSSENLNRKSVKMSEEWGLDLSDVPVFLQRAAR